MTLKERLRSLRDALLHGLIEREVPMRLALLAALAGEHLLLVGPPGTAKSELARRLRLAFRDATYFERLLTRFSVPEELFGPLSIKALEEDRYQRQTAGYLPSASVAFIDEIFKANSAILNSLLTILNEREFDNGHERLRTPLVCVIGASNELPEGDELNALYDRFLLRHAVTAVSDEGFEALIALRGDGRTPPALDLRLSTRELEELRRDAAGVKLPAEVVDLLKALRAFTAEQQMFVSDRRWRKIVGLLQVAAFSDGRTAVSVWDGWLLQYCVCTDPEDCHKVLEWYRDRLGTSDAANPIKLEKLVAAWEKKLSDEKNSKSQRKDPNGNLLYRGPDGKETTEAQGVWQKKNDNDEPLYILPRNIRQRDSHGNGFTENELRRYIQYIGDIEEYKNASENWFAHRAPNPAIVEETRFSRFHVEGRLREIEGAAKQVSTHLAQVEQQVSDLKSTVDQHLWIGPGFSRLAAAKLTEHRERVRELEKKLKVLRAGFERLPVLPEEP